MIIEEHKTVLLLYFVYYRKMCLIFDAFNWILGYLECRRYKAVEITEIITRWKSWVFELTGIRVFITKKCRISSEFVWLLSGSRVIVIIADHFPKCNSSILIQIYLKVNSVNVSRKNFINHPNNVRFSIVIALFRICGGSFHASIKITYTREYHYNFHRE